MFPQTQNLQVPSTRTMISAVASAAATAMLLRSLARDYLPHELRNYIYLKLRTLFSSLSSQLTLVIDEFDGLNHNHLFKAAQLYLKPTLSPNTKRFRVSMPVKETKISVTMERNEEIVDTFNGAQLKWKLVSKQVQSKWVTGPDSGPYNSVLMNEVRYMELSFHKKHKDMVFQNYLPHVLEKSKEVKEERKTLKLFTLGGDRMRGHRVERWQSVNLDHPATFDTLATDVNVKEMIMEDLERFVKRKEFYRKVGKAWKRGYLLFGPPGTGKSSLIAAMANYLNFDIYDLELTEVRRNSDLRNLLISTANRSMLVLIISLVFTQTLSLSLIRTQTNSEAMASCAARLLFQPARVNAHVPLSPLTVSSRSPLLITWDKDKDIINNRFLFKLSQRSLTSVAKSSPESDGIVPADEDGVSLGTLKLPSNTNLQRFESLLFQWGNSLCQGANLPLPVPLKVDKIPGGARLGFITIGDGKTEVLVYIDCLVFPATADSGPVFRAIRNGPLKDQSPPGEPRIMRSLLEALKKSVEIARV